MILEICQWAYNLMETCRPEDFIKESIEVSSSSCAPVESLPTNPHFWLTVLKKVAELKSTIYPADEEVLKSLTNVCVSTGPAPGYMFQLEFHFAPNEFFEDSVLVKTYLNSEDQISSEDSKIYKTFGCNIQWKEGKNITKAFRNLFNIESFFNFFNPPKLDGKVSEKNIHIEVSSCSLKVSVVFNDFIIFPLSDFPES